MALRIRRQSLLEILERRCLLSTIYVDAGATGSTHDGTSWASAFTDLQSALAIASSGDRVEVAGGTYKPTNGTDRTISFEPASGVAIYGGYAGSAGANPDTRNPGVYPTILSGDIGAVGNNSDNSYHVLQTNFVSLDSLTITGGNANGSTPNGGGLYATETISVTNCNFVDNVAQGDSGASGGAVDVGGAGTTFTDCNFDGNSAIGGSSGTGDGGAVRSEFDINYVNCAFVGNSADFGAAVYGGSSVGLNNCTLVANADAHGGGPCWYCGLTNCIVWGDVALEDEESNSSAGYSDTDVAFFGGSVGSDPQFVRNPNPGHDGVWGTADDDYGDLELEETSPCIDAGNNSAIPSGITTDLVGNPRFVDVPSVPDPNGAHSPIVDIGAYEAASIVPVTGGPYELVQGQSITLNGSATGSTDGPWTYAWDFTNSGQFTDSTQTNPTYATTLATSPGIHTIAFRATNPLGENAIATTTVTVDAATVQASAGGPYQLARGYNLQLNGSATTNADGALQYAWDFSGNGLFTDAMGATPTFTTTSQTAIGIHTVSVQVTDSLGQTSVATANIDVEAPTVQASAGGPYNVIAGQSFDLNGSGTTNVPGSLQYAWDFSNNGQFTDATGASPAFSAANLTAGTAVPIELQVTNALGQTSTALATVNIVPSTVYVDANAPGKDNGSDWGNAFTTLSEALSQAVSGQTILVAAGTYSPTSSSNRSATFNLMDGVSIQGGYAGFGALDPDAQRLDSFVTILSGQLSSGNSYHVVTASGVDNTTELMGVTIEDGDANGTGDNANGGGIYISNASPLLQNCFIFNNQVTGDGAGVYDVNSSPQFVDDEFEGNTAGLLGGGMANDNSSPTITSCSFYTNTVTGSMGGGAMADSNSSKPMVSKSFFEVNRASNGGAVYDQTGSAPSFTECVFSSNAANGADSEGGALYEDGSTPTLVHCTISGNSTGIYATNSSAVSLTDCIAWGDGDNSEFGGGSSQYTGSYNDVNAELSGTGNIDNDPKFVANTSAGADGIVGTKDDFAGDFKLLPDSPAAISGEENGNSTFMGAYAYNTDPAVLGASVEGQTVKNEKTIQITVQVKAPVSRDPVKTVDIYSDNNGDREYDAGDVLVGKAHQTKNGWVATVPTDKLPTGESLCFAIAESKSGLKGEDSLTVKVNPAETATITKVSSKYSAGKGKSSGTLSVAATVKSAPISDAVFAIDTNDDGTIDSGDQILYAGDKKNWKGIFAAVSGEHYSVLAKVRNVNGNWSATSTTGFEAS